MTITQHISIDLQQPGNMPMVHAVQGDEYSRKIEIELYSNGVSWNPPDDCEVTIRYGKPDGKGGVYDTLPDNTVAYSIAGNAITVTLAPQMVTVPGIVHAQVSIIKDRKDRISTFSFAVDVKADPSKGELKSENYVNWKSYYIPQTVGATVGQYLQISKVDDTGRIIEVVAVENPAGEATNKAYEALRIANDVAQEMKDYSPSGTRAIAEAAMRTASSRLVAPESASVGQYFRVKEVDANGIVTAVEAVDAPSGGGSDTPGEDGFSPVATVEQTENGAVITITDRSGTTTATVANGKDGTDGQDGSPGKDGSDGVSVTHEWNGTVLKVTSAAGTSSADLKGEPGKDGGKGADGQPGKDGTSPVISVSAITGGHRITITDVNGMKTVDVMDGSDGKNGADGQPGTDGKDGSDGQPGADGVDGKDYSFDPTVYGLPVLYLVGDTSPIAISKDNKVTLDYVYGDRSGTCTLKGQGATSYKKAQALVNAGKKGKFNYTIKFDNAFEAKEGWGAQQKYCLKANFIDATHSRNIVSCILWGMSVKARSTVPSQLANLPNGGAIDGFPIIIMLNGEFHGLYTWNIPKDGWMFGLVEDASKTQAIVGADDHTTATQFKEASMSGFEVEFVSDEDNADWVDSSLTRMISAVMNSTGSDLDTTVAQYLDWDSCIDHYIHTVVDKAFDCVDKNYLLVTFDGVKWYMSAYDRDSIHGLSWDASGLSRPVSNVSFVECADTVKVYELIKRFKTNALKARYKELRGNILSESRIMEKFENFAWAIPSPVMLEDVKLYPTILGSGVNTIDQIGRFVRQRLVRCDEWIDALPAQETPVEPEEPVEMVNQVPISTDTDGSIYNGTGYKDNARLSSSGGVSGTAQNGSVTTGFIPFTPGSTIRIKGAKFLDGNGRPDGHYYVNFYDVSKNFKVSVTSGEFIDNAAGCFEAGYDEATGITTIKLLKGVNSDYGKKIDASSFFRINAYGKGADLIVTVNQEIV